MAGYTDSYGSGSRDIWVLKLTSTGSVSWQKTYGGDDYDLAYSIQQTSDGGFIVAGVTDSYGSGSRDIWVLKLTSTGSVSWQKTYGGDDYDLAYSIQQTSDGGFIVAGVTDSYGSGVYDIWVLKLTSTGSVSWQKTYGGSSNDYARSIQQTSDGGFIVAGVTDSYGSGVYDIWVLKLTSTGSVSWQKTYGGANTDQANSIQQTSDGGFIVAGVTNSDGAGSYDIWVLKLTSTGSVSWQKTYGGSQMDLGYSIQQTSDGEFIATGETPSYGNSYDIWVLKLDTTGNIPDCDLIDETVVTPSDTTVTPIVTTAIPADTTITPQNTSADIEDTDASVEEQCFYELPFCEGDFDVDGDVDGSDLAVFAADFGRTDCLSDCEGDFDGDGDVDGSDLATFASDFGRTDCPVDLNDIKY